MAVVNEPLERRVSMLGRMRAVALVGVLALVGGVAVATPTSAVVATLHYTANANFSGSTYTPGADGFNLADVESVGMLSELPSGTQGLVYLGLCSGADTTFVKR